MVQTDTKCFLVEKRTEKEHRVKDKKKKSSGGGTWISKEEKEELETVVKKLIVGTVDKKAKEAEKQKDAM